jgi:hypothetical protein
MGDIVTLDIRMIAGSQSTRVRCDRLCTIRGRIISDEAYNRRSK